MRKNLNRLTETADAAETIATSYSLDIGQSAVGTIEDTADEDWYAVRLEAGKTYEFRLLGFGKDFLSDPVLKLFDSSGAKLAYNNNGFTSYSDTHEADSRLVYKAAATGIYYVQADALGSQTGDYLLTATAKKAAGMDFTIDEIAWQLINNGEAFFGSTEAAAFDAAPGSTLTVNMTGLTADGQFLARQALLAWTNVTGISFQETAAEASITFDDSDVGTNAYTETNIANGVITSSTVQITTGWLSTFGTSLNSYSFETYMHEIGHALGLGHAGNYNGSASYGLDNYFLNDSLALSIMSYMQAENDDFAISHGWNDYVDASFRSMFTPQIADIVAIQDLYGDYSGAFLGRTIYGFGGNTGVMAIDNAVKAKALMAMTIFDSGGNDLLDMSNTVKNQTITLETASLSSVLGGRYNLGIARDTFIESAFSGAGNDRLTGNGLGNTLKGGDGKDTLTGGFGKDSLYGQDGRDSFVFRTDDSAATKSNADTIFDFASNETIDLSGWAGISSFRGSRPFSGHAGEVHFVKASSDTWISGDTDGDRKADFIIHLDDAIHLKADNFIL